MIKKGIIPVLSVGHGINDMLAGYFLGTITLQNNNMLQAGMSLFIYNILAFGGQYPVALWVERYANKKQFLIAAFMMNIAAAVLFIPLSSFAVVMAGIASAMYHVSGGAVCASNNRAFHIGLFAAPGVAGLIAGGYFAWMGYELNIILLAATILFFFLLLFLRIPAVPPGQKAEKQNIAIALDRHDIIMILLLTVIALRSAVWNIFQLLHEADYTWLIAIACAAFAGKVAGGWLADKIGWRLYIYISLLTAGPLVTFFRNELLLFCMGIGLLQSGIPATTALLIEATKGKTERGIGLSFGTAIIAGGVVFTFPVNTFYYPVLIPAFLLLVSLVLFWFAARKKAITEIRR